MKQNILILSAIGLIMLLSAFTTSSDVMDLDKDKIELLNRSGGTRSTTTTKVLAFIHSNGLVTIEIENYSGTISASIEGTGGVQHQEAQVTGSGLIMMDASSLPGGTYMLRVTLNNARYEGFFEK